MPACKFFDFSLGFFVCLFFVKLEVQLLKRGHAVSFSSSNTSLDICYKQAARCFELHLPQTRSHLNAHISEI